MQQGLKLFLSAKFLLFEKVHTPPYTVRKFFGQYPLPARQPPTFHPKAMIKPFIIFIFLAISILSAAHLLAGTDVAEFFGAVSSANATIAIEQRIVIVKINIINGFIIALG